MPTNLTIHRGSKKEYTLEVTVDGAAWEELLSYNALLLRISDEIDGEADHEVSVSVESDFDLFFTITEAISTTLVGDKYYWHIVGLEQSGSDPETIDSGLLYVLPAVKAAS